MTFLFFVPTGTSGDEVPYPGIPQDQWITSEQGGHLVRLTGFMSSGRIAKLLYKVRPDFVYFNSMYYRYTFIAIMVLLKSFPW
jgi:hypothetical protein